MCFLVKTPKNSMFFHYPRRVGNLPPVWQKTILLPSLFGPSPKRKTFRHVGYAPTFEKSETCEICITREHFLDKVGIFGPTGGGKPNCFLGSKNELKIALNGLKVTKLPWDTPPLVWSFSRKIWCISVLWCTIFYPCKPG